MLLIPCPYCVMERPEIEFRHAGHAHVARNTGADDQGWAEVLYLRDNPKGVVAERWRHVAGCGRYFNCLRDTVSDAILMAYKAGEPMPDVAGRKAEASQ